MTFTINSIGTPIMEYQGIVGNSQEQRMNQDKVTIINDKPYKYA